MFTAEYMDDLNKTLIERKFWHPAARAERSEESMIGEYMVPICDNCAFDQVESYARRKMEGAAKLLQVYDGLRKAPGAETTELTT